MSNAENWSGILNKVLQDLRDQTIALSDAMTVFNECPDPKQLVQTINDETLADIELKLSIGKRTLMYIHKEEFP